MKKIHLKALLLVVLTLFLFSCAKKQVKEVEEAMDPAGQFEPVPFVKEALESDDTGRKVDTLYVIMDASNSMNKSYKGKNWKYTKELLSRMGQTIPSDIDPYITFRTFGHNPEVSNLNTKVWTESEQVFNYDDFKAATENITAAGGRSPLYAAVDAATMDMEATGEQYALIVLTDGEFMGRSEVEAFQKMKDSIGDRVCIYAVQIGDHESAAINFNKIKNMPCGHYYKCDDIESGPAMAALVSEMLLGPDADGDGVADNLDQCPDTPTGTPVDRKGCSIDSDGDGVPDHLDQCPDTPAGVEVDKWGCPIILEPDRVYFDFDKADIKPEFESLLNETAEFIKSNPDVSVEIQGHTDSIGTEEYNLALSERRAKAVAAFLTDQGVNPDQLSTAAFGFSQPIADNDTEEGRAMNRRVGFTITR
jgi:OOP family OmpA-OmpF porin